MSNIKHIVVLHSAPALLAIAEDMAKMAGTVISTEAIKNYVAIHRMHTYKFQDKGGARAVLKISYPGELPRPYVEYAEAVYIEEDSGKLTPVKERKEDRFSRAVAIQASTVRLRYLHMEEAIKEKEKDSEAPN